MKKYSIISLLAIIIGITYFVVRAHAKPQASMHEVMNISYTLNSRELTVSTSDGNDERVKLSDTRLSLVLAKIRDYQDLGWTIKSLSRSGNAYNQFYDYLLER